MATLSVANMEALDLSQKTVNESNCSHTLNKTEDLNTNSDNSVYNLDELTTDLDECEAESQDSNINNIESPNPTKDDSESQDSTKDRKESQNTTKHKKGIPGPFSGLINVGVNCYINTLIQCLFMTPEMRDTILSWNPDTFKSGSFANELQKLFIQLKESGSKFLDMRNLINTVTWFSKDEQQDLLELWHIILDNLEAEFNNSQAWQEIRRLFEGLCMGYVKCLTCETVNKIPERFFELSLDVKGSNGIYDSIDKSLAAYIEPELLTGSNQYKCEVCGIKTDAEKGLAIVKLPYILLLHLQRYEYTETFRRKLNDIVTFSDFLDLEHFMQMNQEILEHNGYISEETDVEDSHFCYELYFVVLHAGTANTGHFSAYIKSLETKTWFLFNDRGVSEMTSDVWIHAFGKDSGNMGCAYVLGYRQINEERNVMTVESVITPVRHEEFVDLQERKPSKRSSDCDAIDLETSADIIATVYCLLKDPHTPVSNVVKVYCETKTRIKELKYTAIVKFHLDILSEAVEYRLVKFNPVMNIIESSCDENHFVTRYYNPVFLLELVPSPPASIPLSEIKLKLYEINANTGVIISDVQLGIPEDIKTVELFENMSTHYPTEMGIIIESLRDVTQVMPKNSDLALHHIDMTKSRYYLVDDRVIPKDITFFKSPIGKIIRDLKSCLLVTLRYTIIDQESMPCSVFASGSASSKKGIFYSWPTTAKKMEGYAHVGITVELNSKISWLYNNIARLINVNENYFDLYILDLAKGSYEGEKMKYSSMTLKNALSNLNLVSYTPTFEIRAEIKCEVTVAIYLLDLNDSSELKYNVTFRTLIPSTIGQIKNIAKAVFEEKRGIDLPKDRCRIRNLSHQGITTVYEDSQPIDKYMTSYGKTNYTFCIQILPMKEILYSKLPDALYLFAAQYIPEIDAMGPVTDLFLRDNSGEEFVNALVKVGLIPIEHLLICFPSILLPMSSEQLCHNLSDTWISVKNSMYTWKNVIIYDGKIIFYKDARAKTYNVTVSVET